MTRPYEPVDGCETVEYRNPAGETVTFAMLAGAAGRMMPPVVVTTIGVPAGNGSRYLGSAHAERAVAVPVAVPGTITDRTELRRWARVLDPVRGEGTLTVVGGDWAGRQIVCVYEAGLDELEENYPNVNVTTLVFRAAIPYWRDGTESVFEISQGESETTWFPFLPLVLGASDAFATFTVDNAGDVDAWPVVEVTGPGQEVTATNLTTGKIWHVTGALEAGQLLVVDTRPGRRQVTIDGDNAFARLTQTSSLWPLVPGQNRVSVSMALTDVSSLIKFTWRRWWLAA